MPTERVRQDDGATLLLMAVMMTLFLGLAAIAVDLGMAYAVKRQLSSAADAAALAGAQEAGLKFKSTAGCPGNVPDPALVTYIQAAVDASHAANAPWGSPSAPTATVTCSPTEVTVAVTERSTLGTFFAQLLGVQSLRPAAAATANVFGTTSGSGLRPFTICVNDAVTGLGSPTTTLQSIYVRANVESLGGETLVQGGSTPWTASNNRIDPDASMGLAIGDYVRLEIQSGAVGAVDGYYWVEDTPANKKYITVSTTLGGTAVDITTDGVVDVYKPPAPVGGGASAWAQANDTVTATAAHGLAVDDRVWVAVRTPASQASLSGFYYVLTTPSASTLTLSASKGGTVFDLTTNTVVDVYKAANLAAASCNPTGSPGNWGYASFGLGGSEPVLKCLIEHGYNGDPGCFGSAIGTNLGDNNPSTPEVTAPGNTGNSIQPTGDFVTMLTALLDKTIVLPVAGTWSQNGSNATYTAMGGASVKVCGFAFPRNNNDPTPSPLLQGSCWNQATYDAAAAAGKLHSASLALQWRYVKERTGPFGGQSTAPADLCELAGPTCLASVRLIT